MSVAYPLDDRLQRYSPASRPVLVRKGQETNEVARSDSSYPVPQQTGPDEFSEYESYDLADWDGAAPITRETVNAARRFYRLLPRYAGKPDTAPGNDGKIGLEWRRGAPSDRTIILIEIGPGDLVSASRYYPGRPVEVWPARRIETTATNLIHMLLSDEPA